MVYLIAILFGIAVAAGVYALLCPGEEPVYKNFSNRKLNKPG